MEIQEAYREGSRRLGEAKVPDAALDAWYLLEYVTGISRASYFGDPVRELGGEEEDRYFALIGERARRIPLQHITGQQEFMGLTFAVNRHVLIPRQDTEVLVEQALRALKPDMRVLDLCTGSGCILISLLRHAKVSGVTGTGTDISLPALETARENAENIGVKAVFLPGDLFEAVPPEERYDMILSNPPYIPTAEIEKLQEEVRLFDPRAALDGREDGLYFYREITRESARHIRAGGVLLFEIGCGQAEAVAAMMREAGYTDLEVKKDLAGLDRVVSGRYSERRRTAPVMGG